METEGEIVCPETAFHFCHIAGKHNLRTVDQGDIVTNLFNRRHVVRGKDDCVSGIFEFEDFFFQQFGIHWVKSAERFVEDQKFRFVNDGEKDNKKYHCFRVWAPNAVSISVVGDFNIILSSIQAFLVKLNKLHIFYIVSVV